MLLTDSSTVDFVAALHHRSWDWFLELPHRLNVAAEIVDDKGVPTLPLVESHAAASLRRLLTPPGNAMLRAVLSATMQSKTSQIVNVEHLDVACFPLALGRSAGGALVLAREQSGGSPSVELETIGSWLSSMIEAQVGNVAGEENDALNRVTSLHRILNHAVTTGSARDVVAAFAEALAVWDDIEVRGYVEDLRGQYVLDVALAGSDPATAPTAMDDELVRGEIGMVRLSNSDAERLGFRTDNDVLIAAFGRETGRSWLIPLSGQIGAGDESRLTLYVSLLREAVQQAEGVAAARIDWAILQHLLVATDDVEAAARAAVGEVTKAVAGTGAALIVTTSNGMHVLSIGDVDAFSVPVASAQTHQIVATMQVLDRYRMVLAVRRSHQPSFMRRERQTVDNTAALFASWLSGVLRRPVYTKDRRAGRQRFEDVIERMAEQTVRHGASVSVVVMAAAEAAFRPGLLREWVANIRGQLRASDLVGTLTESEVAVLLSEATAPGAAAVVQRLRGHLDSAQSGALPPSSIGIATRAAVWPSNESVVNAAREDARRRGHA